jgi:hypothetical protein
MILVAEASSTPQKGAAIGLDADGSGELFTVESYRDKDIRSDLVRVGRKPTKRSSPRRRAFSSPRGPTSTNRTGWAHGWLSLAGTFAVLREPLE